MEQKKLILEKISALGLEITDAQCEMLLRYYEMLVEKNKVMNLTAITEFEEVVTKHFVDSLSIIMLGGKPNKMSGKSEEKSLQEMFDKDSDKAAGEVDVYALENNKGKLVENLAGEKSDRKTFTKNHAILNLLYSGGRLLDLGTGAGFPGIPLKIVFPNLKITLMDSLNKRLLFLEDVIAELGLKNISTVHARAEEFARKAEYREKYDIVVSRAVANLSLLSELCLGFVKKGGHFVPYKAGGSEEEIKAAAKAVSVMGGKMIESVKFTLPGTELERVMPVIRKTENTPAKYPRNGKKLGVF